MLDQLLYLATFPFSLVVALVQAILAAVLFALPVYLHSRSRRRHDKYVQRDLPYGAPGDTTRLVDLYMPPAPESVDNGNERLSYPALVFIQDSGWTSSKRELYYAVAAQLARRGIVVVVPGHRVHPRAQPADMQQDILQLLRWLTANSRTYRIERRRLWLMAHGTGAQLALLAALESVTVPMQPSVMGVIALAGIYDLPALYRTLQKQDRLRARALLQLFHAKRSHELAAHSPAHRLLEAPQAARMPPVWCLHGSRDTLVPLANLQTTMHHLAAADVPITWIAYAGWTRLRWLLELTDTTAFLPLYDDIANLVQSTTTRPAKPSKDAFPSAALAKSNTTTLPDTGPFHWHAIRVWILENLCGL